MGVPGAPDVPTNVWRNPRHRQHIYNETSQDSIVSRFDKISFRWERRSSIIYICLKKILLNVNCSIYVKLSIPVQMLYGEYGT